MPLQLAILGPARLGNVRLGYLSAANIAARAERARLRAAAVSIQLAGVDARVRVAGLTIHDVANDNPNTCSLTIDGVESPVVSQTLRVSLGLDAPRLLFNGSLQEVGLSYDLKPTHRVWPANALDDTPRANRRRPFGTWTTVSATTVAQYLVSVFAPGFTSVHVQAGLPTVSIILDGSEGMNGALTQIANLIGGYFYWEDGDLHLFLTEATGTPDALDATPGRFLDDPPIAARVDNSQLRTRVFGQGHGEAVLADLAAGESIIPLANAAVWFGTVGSGGHAIALSQILAYTGVQLGGGGSLVGPGAAPSTAPSLALAAGAGLGTGAYGYGVVDVTAAGKSLPSPIGTIATGVTAPPPSAPTAGAAASAAGIGTGLEYGTHDYELTYTTPSGETTPGPVSGGVLAAVTPPAPGYTVSGSAGVGTVPVGHTVEFKASYSTAASATDFTHESPTSATTGVQTLVPSAGGGGFVAEPVLTLGYSPDPAVTWIHLWLRIDGGTYFKAFAFGPGGGATTIPNVTGGGTVTGNCDLRQTADTVPGVAFAAQVPLTLPVGSGAVTGWRLWRRFNGTGTFNLVTAGTGASYTDTTPNASLGAAAPATNTATATQVSVTGIALGASPTTSRELYRTVVNGSQLKFLTTIANNTSTGPYVDSTADGSLGANAPTSDTSGIAFAGGQVNAGSTTLLTASAGPFAAGGGWAILSSGQGVRYTGITGNTLTGIPAAGVGAILTTVVYGSAALPAPALTGVTGIGVPIVKGTPINIWVQRDDLAAQAEQAARDGSDGIVEAAPISDERRNEASLIALCDATLARYSRPLVTVTYACRDVKTKSGKPITIDLTSPPIHQTLTIQDVTIDQINVAPGTLPRFTVTASSVRQSLDGLLRQLLAAAA